MPKRKLIKVNEEPENPDGWSIDYADDIDEMKEGFDMKQSPQFTIEELANFCDVLAEQDDRHEYVGTHRVLATYLYRNMGREQAIRLMQGIAEYGGLHVMAGKVRGNPGVFAEFGIKNCWNDWKLRDE